MCGRSHVARTLIGWLSVRSRLPGVSFHRAEVNGGAGALVLDEQQRLIGVISLDVAGGQIAGIRSVVNPEKLTHLGPLGDFGALVETRRSRVGN